MYRLYLLPQHAGVADGLSRLNTYEFRMRSLIWSKINNKDNRATIEDEVAVKGAITAQEETEAVEGEGPAEVADEEGVHN